MATRIFEIRADHVQVSQFNFFESTTMSLTRMVIIQGITVAKGYLYTAAQEMRALVSSSRSFQPRVCFVAPADQLMRAFPNKHNPCLDRGVRKRDLSKRGIPRLRRGRSDEILNELELSRSVEELRDRLRRSCTDSPSQYSSSPVRESSK